MDKTFTMTPMNQYLNLKPGKIYEGEVTVVNPADATEDFYYAASVTPYSVVDEYNTADLMTMSNWSEMVKWAEIENPEGVIKPNQSAKVRYRIKVPLDAPAGGQYMAIAVRSNEAAAKDEGASVRNVLELASVIYAEVEGETTHAGQVIENTVPGFVTSGAGVVRALLVNNGNVHEVATVTIKVRNVRTNETLFPRGEETGEFYELVMPGTSRYVTRELNDLPALGVYEVTQDVAFLGEVSHNTVTMLACPIWFVVLVVVTLGVIIGTVAAKIARRRTARRQKMREIE